MPQWFMATCSEEPDWFSLRYPGEGPIASFHVPTEILKFRPKAARGYPIPIDSSNERLYNELRAGEAAGVEQAGRLPGRLSTVERDQRGSGAAETSPLGASQG